MLNFQAIKKFQKALLNDITIMNLQIVLNTNKIQARSRGRGRGGSSPPGNFQT